jgi:hypothetical protein
MPPFLFQDLMVELINGKLDTSKFIAKRGKPVLYELKVNEDLDIVGDPKNPKRGRGAFETDVTVFAKKGDKEVPFIILEVKEAITSHDIITYSNKALRHKKVYPYLRYGLVSYNLDFIPNRFFKHNEGIDFFLAVRNYINDKNKLQAILFELIENELIVFEQLQKILHNKDKSNFYQTISVLKDFESKK